MIRGYQLPVYVRQTAATAAAKAVWAMRNLGRVPLIIRRIKLSVNFDGTAEATASAYFIETFKTATHTTGTALTVVAKTADDATASGVTDARFLDTGLSDTSVVYGAPRAAVGSARQLAAGGVLDLSYDVDPRRDAIIVPPTYGLAIVIGVTAVIGDSIRGVVEWDEESQGA